jgi:hypothetical protein
MRLEINPISRLADETLLAKMIDGPQESEMTITVAVTDTRDHHWESRNVFRPGCRVQSTSLAMLRCQGAMFTSIRSGLPGRSDSPVRMSHRRCSRHLGPAAVHFHC